MITDEGTKKSLFSRMKLTLIEVFTVLFLFILVLGLSLPLLLKNKIDAFSQSKPTTATTLEKGTMLWSIRELQKDLSKATLLSFITPTEVRYRHDNEIKALLYRPEDHSWELYRIKHTAITDDDFFKELLDTSYSITATPNRYEPIHKPLTTELSRSPLWWVRFEDREWQFVQSYPLLIRPKDLIRAELHYTDSTDTKKDQPEQSKTHFDDSALEHKSIIFEL